MLTYLILKQQPIQQFKCLVVKKYCEWEKGGFGNTIYMCVCVCVCMNGEVDFGLRYDPQVKLNKKINKYTNNNNNNKPFVSKFRVNYGFLTNYIGSANGFFFPLFYLFEVLILILKKEKGNTLCPVPNYMSSFLLLLMLFFPLIS